MEAGKYIPVVSSSGIPLSMVRDAATGQFVSHAVGMVGSGSTLLNPLTAAPQLIMGAGQMYQNHLALQGIKALSASVATLQATTAVIGVGTAVTAALTAVNLWQTLKLRQDVKQMRLEVRDGFLDLKQAFSDQGLEIIKHIQHVAEDVEFRNHRTILIRAYGLFRKALNRLQAAATLHDFNLRNDEITAARDMLFQALADYDNSQLMEDICPAAYIRRRECVWAIEQAIAMTYQMQSEFQAVDERLQSLNVSIRQDIVGTLRNCETQEELDFFFPEIIRIHDHDLAAIDTWQEHVSWYKSLAPSELKQINEVFTDSQEVFAGEGEQEEDYELSIPIEYELYEEAKQKSHMFALRDSLIVTVDPEQRANFEDYIGERAELEGFNALKSDNLQKASPLTIANLLHYFSLRDEPLQEDDENVEEAVAG